jgi:hypothetical protein
VEPSGPWHRSSTTAATPTRRRVWGRLVWMRRRSEESQTATTRIWLPAFCSAPRTPFLPERSEGDGGTATTFRRKRCEVRGFLQRRRDVAAGRGRTSHRRRDLRGRTGRVLRLARRRFSFGTRHRGLCRPTALWRCGRGARGRGAVDGTSPRDGIPRHVHHLVRWAAERANVVDRRLARARRPPRRDDASCHANLVLRVHRVSPSGTAAGRCRGARPQPPHWFVAPSSGSLRRRCARKRKLARLRTSLERGISPDRVTPSTCSRVYSRHRPGRPGCSVSPPQGTTR